MRPLTALAILPMAPLAEGQDMSGSYRRLDVFMAAIASVADAIEALYLVSDRDPELDIAALGRAQSARWGAPVTAAIVRCGRREETFSNHYLAGLVNCAGQKAMYPFAGAAQVTAVRERLARDPDLVFVRRLQGMAPVLRAGIRPRALVFDMDDVAHGMHARAAVTPPRWPGKLATLAHVPALIAEERRAAGMARLTFVASALEQRRLRRIGIHRGVVAVENALRPPLVPPEQTAAQTLLFIGTFDYAPNVEAAERLATRIMPLVRQAVPQARLLLAGKRSTELAVAGMAGVETLGFVANLDALYARTRVVCCPLSNGGGTRVKLIEAAGYGRAMVATPVAAEGLAFVDGAQILLRTDDAGIAAACVGLLRDHVASRRLGLAARAVMLTRYTAAVVEVQVAAMLRSSLQPERAWTRGRAHATRPGLVDANQ